MGRISSIIDEILPIKIIIINVVHCTSPFGQCTPLRTHRLKWVTWANTRHKMLQTDFVTLEQVHSFFDLRQRSEILSKIARQSPNPKFIRWTLVASTTAVCMLLEHNLRASPVAKRSEKVNSFYSKTRKTTSTIGK